MIKKNGLVLGRHARGAHVVRAVLVLLGLVAALFGTVEGRSGAAKGQVPYVDPTYENVFYILLSSSKFFFNYRHTSDVMIFYDCCKPVMIQTEQFPNQTLLLPYFCQGW